MNSIFSKHKWLQIIYGVLFIIAGILVIVVAANNPANISTWFSVICAIGLFIFGSCAIMAGIFSLDKKYFNMLFVIGALSIAIGVVLCTNLDFIIKIIVTFIAVLFLAFGVVECGEAAAMIYFKKSKFLIALFFVLGAIFITLGVVVLVLHFDPELSQKLDKVVYIGIGAILVLVGGMQIFLGLRNTIASKKADKEINDIIVEQQEEIQEPTETEDPTQLN